MTGRGRGQTSIAGSSTLRSAFLRTKGDYTTRISDIAQQAEIAYRLVYHYFENKEKVLDSFFSSAGAD